MLKKLLLMSAVLATVASPAWARELKSIGVSVSTLGNPFFIPLVKGIENAAHKINPNVRVTTVASNYDLGTQFGQIDSFIGAGVDMILLSASDPKGIAPALKRAKDAGIVVIAVDVSATGADATVQTDNPKAGEMACQYLADKIGHKGNVVILNGPPVSSIVQRVAGCTEVLGRYPDIKILSSNQDAKASREGGLNVMTSLLTRFPSIQGVFSVTDAQTLGAELAIKQLHREGIVLTSIDGAPDVIPEIKAGAIQATVAQSPYKIGTMGVAIGSDILNGKKPASDKVLLTPELVDRDTVSDYKGW